MDQAIYTAAAGAMAMEIKLAVISNNISNVNTAGFKRDQVNFENYMRQLDTAELSPLQYQRIPEDVIAKNYFIDTSQGANRMTGNPLDVAINGDGYFAVNTPNGTRYTRCGSFQRALDGKLVDLEGNAVQSDGGDITLTQGEVRIGTDGSITVDGAIVGKLQLVDIKPDALIKEGKNYFNVAPGTTPAPTLVPNIQQGSLEGSNVDAIKEVVGLIETQRAYEMFQKMMRTANDSYGQAIRMAQPS